jgi:hypothetical protein
MDYENNEEDYEEEGEVDLREELINSLEELKRERKKNISLKGEILMLKEDSQNTNSERINKLL